jgi:hypothetical protein
MNVTIIIIIIITATIIIYWDKLQKHRGRAW